MQAADTNIWARAYLNDDDRQTQLARAALRVACAAEGVFVPLLVLAELSCVLVRVWEKQRVFDTLEHILNTNGVVVESLTIAEQALQGARAGGAGFADRMIAAIALDHGAHEILTFDKAFARQLRVRLLH